jgi:hypothetical protein
MPSMKSARAIVIRRSGRRRLEVRDHRAARAIIAQDPRERRKRAAQRQ